MCRSEFEVKFSLEDVKHGILPAPPEFCKVCAGEQEGPSQEAIPNSEEEQQGQVADGFLAVTCKECQGFYRLGFNAEQLLQGTISTQTVWRCTKCRGSPAVKPFVFELPASGCLPCPHRATPPMAVLREAMDPPARDPGVFDALWQVDCDGNADL
eukprot:EG_transcript_34518